MYMSLLHVSRIKRMENNYYDQGEYDLEIPDVVLNIHALIEQEKNNYGEGDVAIGIISDEKNKAYYITNNRTAVIYGNPPSPIPQTYTQVLAKTIKNRFLDILNPEDFFSFIPSPRMFHTLFSTDTPSIEVPFETIKMRRKFTEEPVQKGVIYITQEARDILQILGISSVKVFRSTQNVLHISYISDTVKYISLCLEYL